MLFLKIRQGLRFAFAIRHVGSLIPPHFALSGLESTSKVEHAWCSVGKGV